MQEQGQTEDGVTIVDRQDGVEEEGEEEQEISGEITPMFPSRGTCMNVIKVFIVKQKLCSSMLST